MVLETLETRGHVGGGAVSPPGPPRGPYPANGPGVPMTGPGWRENGRERTGADGIFGGSLPSSVGSGPIARPESRAEPRRSVEVLLPALNEEKGVGFVIDRIPTDRLRRSGYRVRVWVVDGKSTDATLEVARNHGASTFVQTGDGKGNGVRQLIDHLISEVRDPPGTASRVFVMLDADGSYPSEQIPEFVEALEAGSDVVVGSRLLGAVEEGAITSFNLLGNRILSRLAAFLFRVPVSDVCTGMWGFREDSLRHFGLAADGFDLEADLFASACETGARLKELPIEYRRRIGEAKLIPLRTGLLIAWRLLMKRLNRPEDARQKIRRERACFVEETA